MGYRNYLGSLPKKEYNKIKRFTLKELYEYKGEELGEGSRSFSFGHNGDITIEDKKIIYR